MMGCMRPKPLLLTCFLAALLVGCAERAQQPDPLPPAPALEPQAALTAALANAYEIDTVHQEFEMSFSGGGQEFAFTGSADVDNARQQASMSMDMGMLGMTMDMVIADGIVYMRSPAMAGQVDTEWVSMDFAKLNPAAAAQFSGGMGGATDASSYAALLAGVVEAREEGHETVGGVDTIHYVGTIDVVKASRSLTEVVGDELGAKSQRQMERSLLQLKLLGMRTIPFEAWVDADGLLRREWFSMDLGLMPGAEGAGMEMTIDFSGYGEPVDIQIPPRSDVTDITDLVRMQGTP
jgi:hypothetical protein